MNSYSPLVLVHGLWDGPNLFRRLIKKLHDPDLEIFSPHLSHGLGVVPLRKLAEDLDKRIYSIFGDTTHIDILGFSMGGVIARIWLQEFGGSCRTKRFFSVGSPQNGTLPALPVPRFLLPSIADMKIGSQLIKDLNRSSYKLNCLKCFSYFCKWDVMVCPGWKAVLPIGLNRSIPVFTHQQLILDNKSISTIVSDIYLKN